MCDHSIGTDAVQAGPDLTIQPERGWKGLDLTISVKSIRFLISAPQMRYTRKRDNHSYRPLHAEWESAKWQAVGVVIVARYSAARILSGIACGASAPD
jgi:hypothetical protein